MGSGQITLGRQSFVCEMRRLQTRRKGEKVVAIRSPRRRRYSMNESSANYAQRRWTACAITASDTGLSL